MKKTTTDEKKAAILNVLKYMCRIFWGPDNEFCQEIMNGEFSKALIDLSENFDVDLSSAVSTVNDIADEHKDAESLCKHLTNCYVTLFINDLGGIPAPLYQSCYSPSSRQLMGHSAVEMKNRLEAHGLFISLPGNEPQDHLSIMLEYLYYLLNNGWMESQDEFINEAVLFARDNMQGWVKEFHARLSADGRSKFYVQSAMILCTVVSLIKKSGV